MTDQSPLNPLSPPDPANPSGPGPRLYGVVDVIRPERVAGWVIDRANPDAHAEVELLRDGQSVATQAATRPRKDLERGGVGTGRYGFSITLDPPLQPGMEHTVSVVARTGDGVSTAIKPTMRLAAVIAEAEQNPQPQILAEIAALRAAVEAIGAEPAEMMTRLSQQIERLELVQLRLEAAAQGIPEQAAESNRSLWIIACAGGALGLLSLGIGALSLWWG